MGRCLCPVPPPPSGLKFREGDFSTPPPPPLLPPETPDTHPQRPLCVAGRLPGERKRKCAGQGTLLFLLGYLAGASAEKREESSL